LVVDDYDAGSLGEDYLEVSEAFFEEVGGVECRYDEGKVVL
jgi:hypothetical protein